MARMEVMLLLLSIGMVAEEREYYRCTIGELIDQNVRKLNVRATKRSKPI